MSFQAQKETNMALFIIKNLANYKTAVKNHQTKGGS